MRRGTDCGGGADAETRAPALRPEGPAERFGARVIAVPPRLRESRGLGLADAVRLRFRKVPGLRRRFVRKSHLQASPIK